MISGSLSEVVVEHAIQSFSPANRPTINGVTGIRNVGQGLLEYVCTENNKAIDHLFGNGQK